MLFDSPIFIVFLLLVVTIYWPLRWRSQNVFLLLASYFFYGWWDWRFLGLILVSTAVDFVCARSIARSNQPVRRKMLLTISVALNLGFLGFFKYFNFFTDSLSETLTLIGLPVNIEFLRILLPPGISFYTFQALAYIVDVYFGRLEPAESLLDYALFINFFPHLIAGPIQRPSHLLPQVQAPRRFDGRLFMDGIMLILTGLFRKCVIADNCALLANAAFNGKMGTPTLPIVALGTYAFAWQIYGDFSGYSDIARGAAQLMGFEFMVNFRQPYLASSLQDFWRRWHISLSTWLRDYLYIPLGGSRHGEPRTYRNLMTTMLLGGLWHGANWTFVIWGAIHGIGQSIERFFRTTFQAGRRADDELSFFRLWAKRIFIFHLVCLSWVFFRAQSMTDAFHILRGITVLDWKPEFVTGYKFLAIFSLPLFLLDVLLETRHEDFLFQRTSAPAQWAYASVLVLIVAFLSANESNAFIYFQF
ncbi:MAG TPA: MBOAT family O-acyltransferase [Bryobacteraceae bacterium]|jgi:D-alanyl-lipoteichoic acid acyltransferase DltB (MBOAT superfamily)|nr:MBOAT family O-acyltransferase [Bryobacteraceae bacterium]